MAITGIDIIQPAAAIWQVTLWR